LAAIIAVVALLSDTLALNAAVWLVSVLVLTELLKATGLNRRRGITVLVMAGAAVIPFARTELVAPFALPALLLITLGYFALLVKNYGELRLGVCASAFMLGMIVPLFFSGAVYIRDLHGPVQGGFYMLLAMCAAWVSDTGAYFVGTFWGRHKLAPKVSPKKTIEGTLGGAVISTGSMLVFGLAYTNMLGARVDFIMLALLCPVFSIIGMLGDLTASAIKREYDIKDFGAIMPGHGGLLDRFDSLMFTLPAVYLASRCFDVITLG
jgi:phosphatidate cytidylyltransferase